MYLSTCQQELFSGLVFGIKRVWQHDRRFGTYLQTYTYAILNPSLEEQVTQIQCLKSKKLSVSTEHIGAFTPHSGYFCLCGLFLSGIPQPLGSGKPLWLSKNRPEAYRFGTSALLFASLYPLFTHLLFNSCFFHISPNYKLLKFCIISDFLFFFQHTPTLKLYSTLTYILCVKGAIILLLKDFF